MAWQLSAEPPSDWIRQQLDLLGPVPFSRFMEWALYHPTFGYYTRGPAIGPRGDFTTSPEASPAFGRILTRHIADVDALLEHPQPFYVIECGPGRGTLARDMLLALQAEQPELYGRLRYCLVEISPALKQAQQKLLQEHAAITQWAASITDLPQGVQGAVIGNEFIDAFPFSVVANSAGELVEKYVAHSPEGTFQIVDGRLSDPALRRFVERYGIVLQPGEQIEVNLGSARWLKEAAGTLASGVVTLIDYGDTQPGRYSEARKQGTLLGYRGGAVTEQLLEHPGEQDLTALVDFTALAAEAQDAGFDVLTTTRQAAFLVGLGLGTNVPSEGPLGGSMDESVSYRKGVHALISMEGLGKFHVLVLSKGIPAHEAASGLSGLRYAGIL